MSIKGLATGIGSLPHTDAEAAVDLVLKYMPQIPFWPQLPKRDPCEGMVAQFTQNLPCLKVNTGGAYFDSVNKEEELENFYEHIIANDLGYFKITPEFALGLHRFYQRLCSYDLKEVKFIKAHITGPFTFAASINNENGTAILYDPVFMQAVGRGLAMKALWQIDFFRKFGKGMIVFIDEPYLSCFGSAMTPMNREDVVGALAELSASIKERGALAGVHCCGNTDWSIFTEIKHIDIINFDAFGFLEKLTLYADDLKKFFNRGGILCWGIVPTQEYDFGQGIVPLIAKIKEGINILVKKGLDKDLLSEKLLISPACGLGSLDIKKSEQILTLLSQLSNSLKNL